MNVKNILKKNKFLYAINMKLKARLIKKSYYLLRKYYDRIASKQNIVYKEINICDGINNILQKQDINYQKLFNKKLNILYIGTDAGQDFGGIIQGLKKFGKVFLFSQESGLYGQVLPSIRKNAAEFNGKRLLEIVRNILKLSYIDIIIGQMWASTMAPEALQEIRRMGILVVNISMDDRHTFRYAFNTKRVNGKLSGTAGLIGSIDLACTSAEECCLWYQIEGCPSIYLPPASDSEIYKPYPCVKKYDVCFVGANYGIRTKVINAIKKRGINVVCYGNNWPKGRIEIEKLPQIFARSHIVLGIGTIGHCTDLYSLKMRDFDGPMSGSLYITHDNPDLYNLYKIGKEIITYNTPKDCADKIVYYLSHIDEAETIAKVGRKRAVHEHTWEKRFEKVFRAIGIIRKKEKYKKELY